MFIDRSVSGVYNIFVYPIRVQIRLPTNKKAALFIVPIIHYKTLSTFIVVVAYQIKSAFVSN